METKLQAIFARAREGTLRPADLRTLLALTTPEDTALLDAEAYAVKAETVGAKVFYRGLLEFSNRCIKNCLYCGIRRGNTALERFDTPREEILEMAQWAFEHNYGSVTLQSGERQDPEFVAYVESLLRDIKKIGNGALGITLSCGEQSEETYRRWFEAGAHRYLLRIEASNPELYARIHPNDPLHSWQTRVDCLARLSKLGYQVGTGIMIGIPGQTLDDLVSDLLFFKEKNVAMIGMGPYVVHHETPLGQAILAENADTPAAQAARLRLALNTIAVTRIFLRDVNIASATALQALHPLGRELGLRSGANILMPLITPKRFRKKYLLYDNKPFTEDSFTSDSSDLEARITALGDSIGWNQWGDSPHFTPIH